MASVFDHKDRRMIPNWRSFERSIKLGELNSYQIGSSPEHTEEISINDYIFDWKNNKSIAYAADLLSAGVVNSLTQNPFVKEAATYIISNSDLATSSQVSLAKMVLNESPEIDFSSYFTNLTLDELHNLINREVVQRRIQETKKLINSYAFNPILYVELSRLYSVIGFEDKAINAMKIALHLSPHNRFVLRCATRLFAHYQSDKNNYLNYAHSLLKKNPLTVTDPWLMSAEISIATLKNQTSDFIKKGNLLINSKNIAPLNFTELASSLATVELLYGSLRKSKDYFNKALIHPNDNSLAQVEWASQKEVSLNIDPSTFPVKLNFEALALDSYHNKHFENAVINATKWFADMPFSKRPIVFGAAVSSVMLKDQAKAISFLEAGLLSHPHDPQLINNIAYSLALDNKPIEALKQLENIRNEFASGEDIKLCLLATRGLALFRSGFPDEGRKLYFEAMEKAKEIKNSYLGSIAFLNYAREEVRIKSNYVENVMQVINKIPESGQTTEVQILKQDVIELHEKQK